MYGGTEGSRGQNEQCALRRMELPPPDEIYSIILTAFLHPRGFLHDLLEDNSVSNLPLFLARDNTTNAQYAQRNRSNRCCEVAIEEGRKFVGKIPFAKIQERAVAEVSLGEGGKKSAKCLVRKIARNYTCVHTIHTYVTHTIRIYQ